MDNTLRTILIVLAVIVVGVGVFLGGMLFASAYYGNGLFGMTLAPHASAGVGGYGGGMMGGYGGGMTLAPSASAGVGGYGRGMMGGSGYGGLSQSQPLPMEQARKAVESYLGSLGNNDLAIKDIMIFDNGAYAAIEEKSTGSGAFELLVDPVTLAVYPEHGPNMMWNLKYGMMVAPGASAGVNGYNRPGGGMWGGMMGGMMRGWYAGNQQAPQAGTDMPVSSDEASKAAQAYLDANLPGVQVSDEVTPFYGYYTIDVERDGKIVGMLSVNGYSGEVWLHTWHGTFIEQSE